MSIHSIHQYQNEVENIIHFGGTKKETAIRNAFYNLLNEYAKQKGLMIVTEVTIKAINGRNITPDGTLKDVLRQDWGYWESKDESDKIDDEIKKKFDKGYPKENILFEDSQAAVLFQNGFEVLRVPVKDADALHRIITKFINFERPEVKHFRKAIELFKQDIPKVTETIRGIIIQQEKSNLKFIQASEIFLKLCHDSINPNITNEDVREMIIQHILTEDVFNTIFDETQFHRENNIARELETVISTFFTGAIRKTALSSIQHYYQTINAAAAGIADHHEKQKFLKVIYETFYKSYNPKAADRLGVIYTPNEIVQFMIKSTDYLLHKHFNKFLEDKNVEILDPATGTGTFICDMIDYIRKEKLAYKYQNELHANEVAILPYYISNLNIEFTYTQKMKEYAEFENLCFVDTLDNMGFAYKGKQTNMFLPFSEENTKRIKKQNERKIAVIIGNPPYNANQLNENENNKNREYPEIDKRIKETFIKQSTAQKTKVYDMYARFYRWAFDRLDNNGIIAFISNRSFIDSRTFDGFRKTIQTEFDYAYIIDTKSDVRANPKIAGTTHNVFGIQTGVAIMFLVKKLNPDNNECNVEYISLNDFWKKEQKLQWLTENSFKEIAFERVVPDKNNNWINLSDNDFDKLLEWGKIFKLVSPGINTGRDEWVCDFDEANLVAKCTYFINAYNKCVLNYNEENKNLNFDLAIKWSETIKSKLKRRLKISVDDFVISQQYYRPFTKLKYCYSPFLSDRLTEKHFEQWGRKGNKENIIINLVHGVRLNFAVLATDKNSNYAFYSLDPNQTVSLYCYDANGNRIENITDWGLQQFINHYLNNDKGKTDYEKAKKYIKDYEIAHFGNYSEGGTISELPQIKKLDIFHYVYAVLHNPAYRKKYELNLKREFPRIPFYENFFQWVKWGEALMNWHINYEKKEPFALKEITIDTKEKPKAKLKADKENGTIALDENTVLTGIPKEAWTYKLGNRSALEWILDQYKESKPKDPTIAEKFNTYKFADYKQQVIDLLKRVCTVSVETMKIIEQMQE
ncbi:MAG: type ISP restriction/modification enzyme [Chitinophagaceae bacterium]